MNMKLAGVDDFARLRVEKRHLAIQQLNANADKVIYAIYTPSAIERRLSTSPVNSPVTLRLVQEGQSFSVAFNADAFGRSELSLEDIAHMGRDDNPYGRLQIMGAGKLSNFLRGVQHIHNVAPDLGLSLSVKLLVRDPGLSVASAPQVMSSLEKYTAEQIKESRAQTQAPLGSQMKMK